MDISSFIEGPLLKIGLWIFTIGILIRLIFFMISIFKNRMTIKDKGNDIPIIFARFLVPFHNAAAKKPVYSALRYLFHFCLFVVPIWLAGHITLWEESTLEWSWFALPGRLADIMTIVCIILAAFFIFRHVIVREVREKTSIADFIIIVIAGLPFLTGYFLAHGTLDKVDFFANNIWTIHILSGELMIFTTVFLFCRTRLNALKCTGCASCSLSCPTNTLETEDIGKSRTFNYSHYQCICCASCVDTCPEGAAELRHEISLYKFFRPFLKYELRTVEMEACAKCGALFVPEPLMDKIHNTFTDDYLKYCSYCRKDNIKDYFKRIAPTHGKKISAAA